jgi:AraC-like DNA-binding protein
VFVDAPLLESMAAPEEGKAAPLEFDAVIVRGPVAARFCSSVWRATQPDRTGGDTPLIDAIRAVLIRHGRALQAAPSEGVGPRPLSSPLHAAHRAADYLHAHVAEPVSLDELACVACLSKFHLTRVFHSKYGLPPHAYQLQLRLAYVKQLIVRGVSVSSAAESAGFAGPMHLYRHFRARYGVAPGYYAPQRRAGITPAEIVESAVLARRE